MVWTTSLMLPFPGHPNLSSVNTIFYYQMHGDFVKPIRQSQIVRFVFNGMDCKAQTIGFVYYRRYLPLPEYSGSLKIRPHYVE